MGWVWRRCAVPHLLTHPVLSLALLLFGVGNLIAREEPAVRVVEVRDGIYALYGRGGNIGLSVGKDGPIMIDDQFAARADLVKAAIAEITPEPVAFVINTHWHFDHSDGNPAFGRDGAIIVAHDKSRARMLETQHLATFNITQEPYPEEGLPHITMGKGVTFHWNGHTIEVVHPGPSHTDGDVFVFFKEANVVHTGDVFVRYGFPFIDSPHGGSIDGMIAANEYLLGRINAETKIIPGHGEIATRAEVEEFVEMLRTARERIGALVRSELAFEEILSFAPLAGLDYPGIKKDEFIRLVLIGMGVDAPDERLE